MINSNQIFLIIRSSNFYNQTINHIIKSAYFKPFVAWILWITIGTIFYCYQGNLGWSKGFYMAVNVGYSIG